MYVYDAKSDGVEESEQKCDESIREKVKVRRQKADDKTDEDESADKQLNIIDMFELESDESAKRKGQRLKILTPQQMLSRLPISLAQSKAGNNSEKPKNEIIQLLYSLYRSKKLCKTIYKHLMNAI